MCDELEFLAMDYSDIAQVCIKEKKTTIFNFYRAKHNVVFYSQVYSIGRSVEGRQILGIKITADVGAQRPQLRPQVTDQL